MDGARIISHRRIDMARRETYRRRVRRSDEVRHEKARRILKGGYVEDVRLGAEELGDFLGTASEMIDQTETYPVYEEVFDLSDVDESTYEYVIDVHKSLKQSLNDWRGMVRYLNRRINSDSNRLTS